MAQRKDIIIGGGPGLSERMGEYFSHKLLGAHRKVGCTVIVFLLLIVVAIAVVVIWKGGAATHHINEKADPAIVAEETENMRAGREAMQQMDFAKAEQHFARVTELNPTRPAAWMALAGAQLKQGNDEGALHSLLHRNKLQPGDPRAHFEAMAIYKRMGKNQEALQAAREAARLEQLNPLYTNTLYIMRIQNGELEQVSDELNRMATMSRTLEPTFIFGRAAVALAQGDEDASIRYVLASRRMVNQGTFAQLFYNDFFKPIVDRLTAAIGGDKPIRPTETETIEEVIETLDQQPEERQPVRNERRQRQR